MTIGHVWGTSKKKRQEEISSCLKDQHEVRQWFHSCLMKIGEQPGDVASSSRQVNCRKREDQTDWNWAHTRGVGLAKAR